MSADIATRYECDRCHVVAYADGDVLNNEGPEGGDWITAKALAALTPKGGV